MKKQLFTLSLILLSYSLFSQTKNVIWFSPSKVQTVNGIMLNFWEDDFTENSTNPFPTTNGIELNLNLVSILASLMGIVHLIDPEAREPLAENLNSTDMTRFRTINGLEIGVANFESRTIQGVGIKVVGSFATKVSGIAIAGLINKNYRVNGLSIAGLYNIDVECHGAQIGLFNKTKKLRGFQFGLWNKNEKRSLPFINWNFSN